MVLRRKKKTADNQLISRICDVKAPWPWPKITPLMIKYEFETGKPMPFLTEQYMIKLYNAGAKSWNEWVKTRN